VGYDGPTYTTGQAVVWTNTGTWGVAALPTLAGADTNGTEAKSYAYGINNSNIVAGFSHILINTTQFTNAVTWTYNGSSWAVNDLINRSLAENLTGRAWTQAVNSSGLAVGASMLASFPDVNQYAAYFSGGKAIKLSLPYTGPAGRVDTAWGINDSGVIVGSSATGDSTTAANHAFIYDNANGLRDMNTEFASMIPSGWTLTAARGIDNNGDIVGYMYNGTAYRGFLLAAATPLPGDANLDGTVNITDLSKVLTNYDKTGMTWGEGDFNGDGTVNISDLSNVLTNYDKTATAAGIKAVPEPSALVLLAAGAGGLLSCLWRRWRSYSYSYSGAKEMIR
jgi:probable HAF family extracellular repeat protein